MILPLRAPEDHTCDVHLDAARYVRILDGDATLTDDARCLRAMRGFHAPIEDILASGGALDAAGFDAAARRNTDLLDRDLCAISPCAIATPRCGALPETGTLAGRIRIAHVIEGSTLGSKLIVARLPLALAGLRGTATSLLEGYGPATGARWRSFGAIVERVITTPEVEAEAIGGARQTFIRLIDWLARFERPHQRRIAEAS